MPGDEKKPEPEPVPEKKAEKVPENTPEQPRDPTEFPHLHENLWFGGQEIAFREYDRKLALLDIATEKGAVSPEQRLVVESAITAEYIGAVCKIFNITAEEFYAAYGFIVGLGQAALASESDEGEEEEEEEEEGEEGEKSEFIEEDSPIEEEDVPAEYEGEEDGGQPRKNP